jgi:hypothetical protein
VCAYVQQNACFITSLSMVDMPLDAAFLCDKAAVLSDMTHQMPYIMYCCLPEFPEFTKFQSKIAVSVSCVYLHGGVYPMVQLPDWRTVQSRL